MPVPLDPRWVPVTELPLDLLNTLRDELVGEPRHFGLTARREPPNWARVLGFLALAIGVLVALVNPAVEGFENFWRYGMLIAGAILLAVFYTHKRAYGYATRGQRLLVGTTSLVLVDAWSVRVFPAEKLVVQDFGSIVCDGETVCQGPHPTPWRDALKRAVDLAKKDAAARETDRWRVAASRAKTPVGATGPRLVPRLVAVAIAVTGVVAVEAGPLHLRAEPLVAAREEARERSERYYREQNERYQREQRERAERAERERAARVEQLRADAMTGTADQARALLATPGDAPETLLTQVRERLSGLCTAAYPIDANPRPRTLGLARPSGAVGAGDSRQRGRALVLSHLLVAACNDPDAQLHYRAGANEVEAMARQVANDVTASVDSGAPPILVQSSAWSGTTGAETLQTVATCVQIARGDSDYDYTMMLQGQRCTGTAQLIDVNGDPVRGASYPVSVTTPGTPRPTYRSNSYGGSGANTYVPPPRTYGGGGYRYGTH